MDEIYPYDRAGALLDIHRIFDNARVMRVKAGNSKLRFSFVEQKLFSRVCVCVCQMNIVIQILETFRFSLFLLGARARAESMNKKWANLVIPDLAIPSCCYFIEP